MRLFLLSVAMLGLIGVGAAWAADDSAGAQSSTADSQTPVIGDSGLQKMGEEMDEAMSERMLARRAEEKIGQQKCKMYGKQYDNDLKKCVDDANVQYRYERKWDPLFGDMPVPEPLFNNVR